MGGNFDGRVDLASVPPSTWPDATASSQPTSPRRRGEDTGNEVEGVALSRRELAIARAKSLRKDMTLAEVRLWDALRGRRDDGLKFRRQHPEPPYIIDFVERGARLAIEVDGATHGEDHEIAHDMRRTRYLESKGWTVVRVGNDEVYEHLSSVVAYVLETAHRLKGRSYNADNPPIDPATAVAVADPLPPAGGEKTLSVASAKS